MPRKIIALVIGFVFLSGCQKILDLGDRRFVGATGIGDSLAVELNKSHIMFRSEGKANSTISGQLLPVENHDRTAFTIKEKPDWKIILGTDIIVFGTNDGSRFGVGLANSRKNYSINDIVGMYNFVLAYYSENQRKYNFGTFELAADYSWRSWRFVDGSNADTTPYISGYWVDSGKGEINAFSDDKKLYATMAFGESSDLMVVNLIGKNGIVLGVKQRALMQGDIDGDYTLLGTKGKIKEAHLIDKTIFKMNKDQGSERKGNEKLILSYNKPWTGFISDEGAETLIICAKDACFCLNIGTITQEQYIVAAVKKR